MHRTQSIEVMAPVGSYESLMAAFQGGADAVYFGVEQLNMRARSTINFTTDDLEEVVQLCHDHGVKAYLTINTILYDHDIILMKRILKKAKEADVDAVIVMDQAAIMYARSIGLEVHISTQINITNLEWLNSMPSSLMLWCFPENLHYSKSRAFVLEW